MTAPVLRLVVSGGRGWARTGPQRALIRQVLSQAAAHATQAGAWQPGTRIVLSHGDCHGTDRAAAAIATELGWETDPWTVDWDKAKRERPHDWKQAGPERNRAMCRAQPPAWAALIFPGGDGTANCAREAEAAGMPTYRFNMGHGTPTLEPHSITVTAADFPATLDFYVNRLGMSLATGPATTNDGRPMAVVKTGTIQLEILQARPGAPSTPAGQLGFTCHQAPLLAHQLAKQGITAIPASAHQPQPTTYTDPTGTRIVIRTPQE